jgi:hypothetical protein
MASFGVPTSRLTILGTLLALRAMMSHGPGGKPDL